MTIEDFMKRVRRAALRVGVEEGPMMAFLLASAHVESRMRSHNQPSGLALRDNNIFGIRWIRESDEGRYPSVEMEANPFDKGQGETRVKYRRYESLEHCIENWLWHIHNSSYHAGAKIEAHRTWTQELGKTWQLGNDDHPRTVGTLYDQYLNEE